MPDRTVIDELEMTAENERLFSSVYVKRSHLLALLECARAGERLLSAAKLLQANAEGCAANHYADDLVFQGLPGWLADTAADIERARQALAALEGPRA